MFLIFYEKTMTRKMIKGVNYMFLIFYEKIMTRKMIKGAI